MFLIKFLLWKHVHSKVAQHFSCDVKSSVEKYSKYDYFSNTCSSWADSLG